MYADLALLMRLIFSRSLQGKPNLFQMNTVQGNCSFVFWQHDSKSFASLVNVGQRQHAIWTP